MTSPTEQPPLSVVMPVFNALPHLDAAVRSILDQSWSDFEFVIFDDGSTDGSTGRLREWAGRDPRIRLVEGQRNLGPAGSSNHVVRLARAPLIARMDADDISHPERLQRQISLLRRHPEIGLVGTMHETIDAEGRTIRGANYWRLARPSWFVPFPHGSIMYRREIFDRLGGYREGCVYWEDQDLFLRASAITRIVTIPSPPLYKHRHSPVSTRVASDQARVEQSVDLMYRAVGHLDDGSDYDELLGRRGAPRAKVDPRVFVSLGSLILWAGQRPAQLRRLLSRGQLSANIETLGALVWTSWASVSPSTLRSFLRLLAAFRNASLDQATLGQDAVEWRPLHDVPRPRPTTAAPANPP